MFQVSNLYDSFVAPFKPGTCDSWRLYLWISNILCIYSQPHCTPKDTEGYCQCKRLIQESNSKTEQSYGWKIMPQLQTKRTHRTWPCRLVYCKLHLRTLPLSIYNISPCITETQVNLHQPKPPITPNPSVHHI